VSDRVGPEISIILVTPSDCRTLRKTLACLRAQTIRKLIEVVIVAPTAAVEVTEEDQKAFHGIRVVACETDRMLCRARAEGVRQASAPIVVLGEDHCYPEPDYAEALLARHREGYAVVGPEMVNAGPPGEVGRVSFLLAYGAWAQPAAAGEMPMLPGHNSSYRRDLLLAFGAELDALLAAPTIIQWELLARGHRLYLEPRAKTHHLNWMSVGWWLVFRFVNGRIFASLWSRQWSWPRRLRLAALSPAIALKKLRPSLADVRRTASGPVGWFRIVVLAVGGLMVEGLGYLAGFTLGSGKVIRHEWSFELDRAWFDQPERVGVGAVPR
jgi:glycosyltransferase involved in cell wall biosynthesis